MRFPGVFRRLLHSPRLTRRDGLCYAGAPNPARRAGALRGEVKDPPAGIRGLVHQLGPVLIAATTFSVSDVFAKISLEAGSDVLSLLAFRSVVGIGIVFIWMRLGAASVKLSPRLKWISLGLGLVLTLNLFGVFKAIELVPVSIAILTYFVYPLLTGLVGACDRHRPADLAGRRRPPSSPFWASG